MQEIGERVSHLIVMGGSRLPVSKDQPVLVIFGINKKNYLKSIVENKLNALYFSDTAF